jgi:predicted acylesterase/phospholipase RssA
MADFCERVIKLKNFEDLKIPLAVTATDIQTGDTRHRNGVTLRGTSFYVIHEN